MAAPETHAMPPVIPAGRDLRLDLFRGLALWLIFLDHIPSNMVSWITIRNYGFSDATEIFVFISGYTAAFVYGREMRDRGVVVASARILKRAWQVYVAHIFLFVIYMAEISYVAASFDNPLYGEEMGIFNFLKQPDVTLIQALLLKFKPANMDVLPLYIVLLTGFPPMLWLLLRRPMLALSGFGLALRTNMAVGLEPRRLSERKLGLQSAGVAASVRVRRLVRLGRRRADRRRSRSSRLVLGLAAAYLVFAFAIALTWYVPHIAVYVPRWLAEWMYPIDKTNLDVLRFAHFLALAALTVSVRAARLDRPCFAVTAAGDFVRATFTRNFLFGRILGVRRSLCDGRDIGRHRHADRGQRVRNRRNGGDGGADNMV